MLIIERKAKEFPPDGQIPADNETLENLEYEVAEVALYDPALEDIPSFTLAQWIKHPTEKYTFAADFTDTAATANDMGTATLN